MARLALILASLLGQAPSPGPEGPPARIEVASNELGRASMVRLDFADRPLDEVLRAFGSPSASRLAWHPDTPEVYRRQRVTIREPGPLPFWTAIDRLCRAGVLKYVAGTPGGRGDGMLPGFRLFLAPGSEPHPQADYGPLRLQVVYLGHSRQLNLIPNRPEEPARPGTGPPRFGELREDFRIDLQLLAEPRLLISRVGGALITEAVDDRGQSLLPDDRPYLRFHHSYPGMFGNAQACVAYDIHLKHPERAGKVIKRFKLILPVEVVALEPGRMVIPLADARGKTFRHGKTTIQFLGGGRVPSGKQTLTFKIKTEERIPERLTIDSAGELALARATAARTEINANFIQVLDRHGRQFPHFTGGVDDGPDPTAVLMLWGDGRIPDGEPVGRGFIPFGEDETAVPAELHHSNLSRGIVKATFELTDIPMP
jgi:hypothetical protein